MKRMACACLVAFFVILVCFILAEKNQGQSPPKLDCQKMVLEYSRAVENKDYKTFCQLTGQEYAQEKESDFKSALDGLEAQGKLAPYIGRLRLFPEIEEIEKLPFWVMEVDVRYNYIEGNKEIEFDIEFALDEGVWIIAPPEPDQEREIEMADIVDSISQAPPEGQKKLDLGLNDLKKNFLLALKEKDWEAVELYIHFIQVFADEKEQHLIKLSEHVELLEHIPSIGAVPAPARSVYLQITGLLEGKSRSARIRFGWRDNKPVINHCDVFLR